MNRLAVKTAIVTGGAVGIGRACVIRMAEEGLEPDNIACAVVWLASDEATFGTGIGTEIVIDGGPTAR